MRGSIQSMTDEQRRELRQRPLSGAGAFEGIGADLGVEFSSDGLVTNEDDVIGRLLAKGVDHSEAPGRVAEIEAWGQFAAAKSRLLSIEMPDDVREAVEDLIWAVDRRGTAAYGLAVHRYDAARGTYEKAAAELEGGVDEVHALTSFLLREKGIEVVDADGRPMFPDRDNWSFEEVVVE